MSRCRWLVALGVLVGLSPRGWAEVREVQPNSFRVESSVTVPVAAPQAYRSLVRVGSWWDPAHTWSGSARNLSLDPRAGGCFCEKLPDGSVQHARVVFAQPGKLLRMEGSLGPLQQMPVQAVLTFAFAAEGAGTRVTLTYWVSGAFSMDPAKLAAGVDQVLAGQLARFETSVRGRN